MGHDDPPRIWANSNKNTGLVDLIINKNMRKIIENTFSNRHIFFKILVLIFLSTFLFSELQAQNILDIKDPDEYVVRANELFNSDDWENGKKIVDEGLSKYPKNSDLRMLSGKYYLHKKEYDRARYDLVKSLDHNPNNVDSKQLLVNVEQETKRYSSAICYVNELLEVNPYWRGLWQRKIDLYELQGNTVEANRLRKRLAQIYPNDTKLQSDYQYHTEMQAIENRKQGNIDEAIVMREELLKEDPKNLENSLSLINDYIFAGDNYKALSYIDRTLNYFPNNEQLVLKKASLLSEQKRYNEVLSLLQQQMRYSNSSNVRQQYNYYLLEAARNAKDIEPSVLYGKILDMNPGNEEAFNFVYNDAIGKNQFEEALYHLNRYRNVRGESKSLSLREINAYKMLGNKSKVSSLTEKLFHQYPTDTDIRDEYVKIKFENAKQSTTDQDYLAALNHWKEVLQFSEDPEIVQAARNAIFTIYIENSDYTNALNMLNEIISSDPANPNLFVKRSDIYFKMKRYHNAMSDFETAIKLVDNETKPKFLGGYEDLLIAIIKELDNEFKYEESMSAIKRWLETDSRNLNALQYAVNHSYRIKDTKSMQEYAEQGIAAYPDELFFKIKLAELEEKNTADYSELYANLHNDLRNNKYNENLITAFAQIAENYGLQLIKRQKIQESLSVLDTALTYAPNNNSLKYAKGVAFEKIHQYDSAYYYQSFYVPSYIEEDDFKQYLKFLNYKSNKNEIVLSHLRSRHGHDYTISSISTIEYSRFEGVNTYTGRINYAGRPNGKGYQIQGEWDRIWGNNFRTGVNAAWANQFFPVIALNASAFKYLFDHTWEGEIGVGYRYIDQSDDYIFRRTEATDNVFNNDSLTIASKSNLFNFVLGMTKELDNWRLNVRLNNFLLNKTSEMSLKTSTDTKTSTPHINNQWLFNVSGQVHYYINTPKTYVLAMASAGNAPDVDMLLNYDQFNTFSIMNTMVGAGFGYMLSKTISASILGTWYNYKSSPNPFKMIKDSGLYDLNDTDYQYLLNTPDPDKFRNLYNIYLQVNVAF
ncbi:MAG: tetratricopeptide repeat protein [Candidatus Gastranaerophilales bacterium]|nr:tetratricopeptide repeat protein [Candidatus Gastranaerophilales bacterium]